MHAENSEKLHLLWAGPVQSKKKQVYIIRMYIRNGFEQHNAESPSQSTGNT